MRIRSLKDRKATSRKPRHCIFCDSEGVTREHVFPDWMKVYRDKFGDNNHTIHHLAYTKIMDDAKHVERAQRKRAGPAHAHKIAAVCARCNNGWMSRLEMLARPLLKAAIEGSLSCLSLQDKQSLATWTVLKSIIAEFDDPRSQTVTKRDRRFLFEHRRPNFGAWNVWAANKPPGGKLLEYDHVSDSYYDDNGVRRSYIMTTSFVIGTLFLHARYCSAYRKSVGEIFSPLATPLRELWPAGAEDVDFGPESALSSDQRAKIVNELADAIDRWGRSEDRPEVVVQSIETLDG